MELPLQPTILRFGPPVQDRLAGMVGALTVPSLRDIRPTMNYIIYGTGGHAREIFFQLVADGHGISCFADDRSPDRLIEDLRVENSRIAVERFPDARWIVAIGNPRARQFVTQELLDVGANIGSFVSKRAFVAPDAIVGPEAQIFANAVVSTGCTVGKGVIMHFGSILCHDSSISDYSILCPGVVVPGNVEIGHGVFVGAGASFRDGRPEAKLKIHDGSMIGAGSCVVRDVAPNTTVAGVPAVSKQKTRRNPI